MGLHNGPRDLQVATSWHPANEVVTLAVRHIRATELAGLPLYPPATATYSHTQAGYVSE